MVRRALPLVVALIPGCTSDEASPAVLGARPDADVGTDATDTTWDAEADGWTDADGGDGCGPADGPPVLDGFGGDTRLELAATGFFRLERVCGRDWLVTPAGHPFYSFGVNTVSPDGSANRVTGERAYRAAVDAAYTSLDAWADATSDRLRGWGLNTAGSWSRTELLLPRMPVTINLSLADHDWQKGEVADYFDPAWAERVAEKTEAAAAWAEHENVVGYFIDNEIRWGPDWRGTNTLLQLFLGREAAAPGKAVAVDHILDGLDGVAGVNAALGTAFVDRDALLEQRGPWRPLAKGASEQADALTTSFLVRTAERYFATTAAAIRAADSNHLVLGNREVSMTTRLEVFQAAAPYVDALSINNYVFREGIGLAARQLSGALDPADGFALLHAVVDMPILITEFGFRAADSGLPNSWPPIYPTLATQQERTDAYADYAHRHQQVPWIIGYHWFAWVDQPADGRFDGENNNWGLVTEADEPYPLLTQGMARVNAELWGALRLPLR